MQDNLFWHTASEQRTSNSSEWVRKQPLSDLALLLIFHAFLGEVVFISVFCIMNRHESLWDPQFHHKQLSAVFLSELKDPPHAGTEEKVVADKNKWRVLWLCRC